PLFGVFDEPVVDNASAGGVVLCYPHGADYATAFRTFRILSTRLARAGFHVLRFDYLGTGDSSGNIDDASLPQWIDNVATAVEELRKWRDIREISLVGLRLGATLAALAAAESQQVDRLVLWEPVTDGREYVATQRALHMAWVDEVMRDGREPVVAEDEMLGYRLTEGVRHDLENLNLWARKMLPAPHIYVLSQGPSPEYERLAEELRAMGAQVDSDCVDGPTVWSKTPSMDEAFVPTRAMQAIVNWLAGASR
ncbi:MAG TPA: alpha/beta fold hydrolase, partial [Vicinamibacterales bacterium]